MYSLIYLDIIRQPKQMSFPKQITRESKDDILKRFCSETLRNKRACNRLLDDDPGHIGDFHLKHFAIKVVDFVSIPSGSLLALVN